MIDPSQVTAVLVTDGRSDLAPVLESLPFQAIYVWDNRENNRKVYGRYLAVRATSKPYIYTQDDDCLIDSARLCAEYQPGELLCNVLPDHARFYAPTGIALVGWGAIFPRAMVDFSAYLAKHPEDDLFDRECDRVFTWLNRAKTRVVDIGVTHLPHAHAADRMGRESRHGADLAEIRRRLAA